MIDLEATYAQVLQLEAVLPTINAALPAIKAALESARLNARPVPVEVRRCVTAKVVAKRPGLSTSTIHRMANAGKLPFAVCAGRRHTFDAHGLEQYASGGTHAR